MRKRNRNAIAAPVLHQLASRTVRFLRQRPRWVAVGDDHRGQLSPPPSLVVTLIEQAAEFRRRNVSDRLIQ